MNSMRKYVNQFLTHRPPFFAFIRPIELQLIAEHKSCLGNEILDFGCGDGFFASQIFADREIEVGLDFENELTKNSPYQKVYQQVSFYQGRTIPYERASFSGVVSNSVLEHVDDVDFSLEQIHQVLDENGHFLTTVMTDQWEKYLLGKKVFGQVYLDKLRKMQDHYHLLSFQQWQEKFEQAGFKVEKAIGYLPAKTIKAMELAHYWSVPSLLKYKLTGSWGLGEKWHQWLKLANYCERLNTQVDVDQAGSVFFQLRKV